jgi:hypothetical protein
MYPYITWTQNQFIDIRYALGAPGAPPVQDGSNTYTSLLYAMYDAVVAALQK